MTDSSAWVPEGVDITVPNPSRVYDYALGGIHNFEVDRQFWAKAEQLVPNGRLIAKANRAFLGRAVRWLAESGIRQFLDLGSGIPTLGNVHEVAQDTDPLARVMYVDIDPVAVEQSRSLLQNNRYATAIRGDLREPDAILRDPRLLDFLDFGEPIAVLMVSVLHFVTDDDDPRAIINTIGSAVTPASFLVVSHLWAEPTEESRRRHAAARKMYEQTPTPLTIRDAAQVAAMFEPSFELLAPGVIVADQWRPDPESADEVSQPSVLAAIGRRR